jgi:hypothetical protein
MAMACGQYYEEIFEAYFYQTPAFLKWMGGGVAVVVIA